ncbi:DNA-3-methyladenine glycosylase [Plakobranchus ocellatus]|uniref:DNA-3-methyladenine glycosylase n=1 Tax=Plakobranchus ocellatus TaxID=259542 RepID=A0AAV4BBA2_9GAST|nr:DNA-3-methyladenine glycosylase [Plakobranchus ocellatus]
MVGEKHCLLGQKRPISRQNVATLNADEKSKYFKADEASDSPKTTSHNGNLQTESVTSTGYERLGHSFFQVPCAKLAMALLGKRLVRKIGSQRISGKIVETEGYLGHEDKAAHSYQGKRTERNEAMFMHPGTAYVYNIYGMYCCFNISSAGEGCAVLVRALEPIEGISTMHENREKSSKSQKKQKDVNMTNGPSKLCQALQITKDKCNKMDLVSSDELWLEDGDAVPSEKIVQCPRINIGYAEEWQEKPLRFYVKDNRCVSVQYKG